MNNRLTFLPVSIEHAPLCARLESLCFDSEVFDESMIRSLLSTPFVFGYLAILNEEPIGYALCSKGGDEGDLLTIAVLPETRGKGYGEALLNEMIKEAKHQNIEKIFLEVRPSNTSAIKLYKKHGATQVGIRKNYYSIAGSNMKEDALVMELNL